MTSQSYPSPAYRIDRPRVTFGEAYRAMMSELMRRYSGTKDAHKMRRARIAYMRCANCEARDELAEHVLELKTTEVRR